MSTTKQRDHYQCNN